MVWKPRRAISEEAVEARRAVFVSISYSQHLVGNDRYLGVATFGVGRG